jgi:hypothetical protein
MVSRAKSRGINIKTPMNTHVEFNASPENARYILGTNNPVVNVYNEKAMIEHRRAKNQKTNLGVPKKNKNKTLKKSKLSKEVTNKNKNNWKSNDWLKDWINNNV